MEGIDYCNFGMLEDNVRVGVDRGFCNENKYILIVIRMPGHYSRTSILWTLLGQFAQTKICPNNC